MSTAPVRRSAPPLRRREEARALFRNAILEAAEIVFAERGFHGARIQDIAARARIAVGTVYNHFEQKEDVLRALLEERTEGFTAELAPMKGDPPDFEGRLHARVGRILRYVETHRAFFTVAADHGLIGTGSSSAVAKLGGKTTRHLARARSLMTSITDEGVAAGVLEPRDRAALTRFLGALIRAFTLSALQEDPSAHLSKDADLFVQLFLRGASRTAPGAAKGARSAARPRK